MDRWRRAVDADPSRLAPTFHAVEPIRVRFAPFDRTDGMKCPIGETGLAAGKAKRLPGEAGAAARGLPWAGLDACQAGDALRLAAGPARAAADVAARAACGTASQPGLVISQHNAAVRPLDAVDPLDRAARQGYVLARDQGHVSSVTQSGHRCGRPVASRRRWRLASSPAPRCAGRARLPIRRGCRRSSPGSSHRQLASLGHPWRRT